MIKKKKTAALLDDSGSQNLFNQIKKLWIEPEFDKRLKDGSIDKNFTVNRCMVKFPKEGSVVVNFNDEVRWMAIIRKDHDASFNKGDPIHIHQVNEILDVKPPTIDNKRVGFVFLHIVDGMWRIFFDFTPNHDNLKEADEDWQLGKEIAKSYQNYLEEQTILVSQKVSELLQTIGLWAAPALISYPLGKIIKQLLEKNETDARKTLVDFCTADFLEKLSKKWYENTHFTERKKILEQAIVGHKQSLYMLTIPTLLPLIEGIITDWAISKVPEKDIPWRQESKIKKFQDIILKKPSPITYNIIVNSAINFILSGPVLSSFKNWLDEIQTAFPNRHVVEHGKFDEEIFSEENSIKLFLLVDTIFHIISENDE